MASYFPSRLVKAWMVQHEHLATPSCGNHGKTSLELIEGLFYVINSQLINIHLYTTVTNQLHSNNRVSLSWRYHQAHFFTKNNPVNECLTISRGNQEQGRKF